MADIDKDDEYLDPVVRAAMIPDPDDETSEDKGAKKSEGDKSEKTDDKTEDNKSEEDAKKTEDDTKDSKDTKSEEKQEADKGKEDPNKEVPKAKEGEEAKSTDEQRQTRKEKREERKQRFIEKIRREQPQTDSQKQTEKGEKPSYKPIDYNELDQVDAKNLEEDRSKYGEAKLAEGREAERKVAEQEKFWTTLEHEATVLAFDPKYAFLDENSASFDGDRAANINEMYLELVGFDAATKSVRRTDLSYERFAKVYIDQMESYADERQAETVKNLATQASNAGIRPGGGAASAGLKKLRPGDISRMSQEEFEKNEAEIDRQILAELG